MKRTPLLILALLLGLGAATAAEPLPETPPAWTLGFSFGLDWCSEDLTYGLVGKGHHGIVTPSAAFSLANDDGFTLTLGAKAIFDTTNYGAKEGGYGDRRHKVEEFVPGITLARTWDTAAWLGSALDTALNYSYEWHPDASKKPALGWDSPNTQYLYLTLSAPDFWLVPTLTVEWCLDDNQGAKGGLYAAFDLRHAFDVGVHLGLAEGTLTLTPILGFGAANKARNLADFDADDPFMLRNGYATLNLAYTPIEGFTITPYVGFHQQLDSTAREATGDDDFVLYGGLGLSYAF